MEKNRAKKLAGLLYEGALNEDEYSDFNSLWKKVNDDFMKFFQTNYTSYGSKYKTKFLPIAKKLLVGKKAKGSIVTGVRDLTFKFNREEYFPVELIAICKLENGDTAKINVSAIFNRKPDGAF